MVHGKWPPFTFRKGVGEGFLSRLPYTYIGVVLFSIAFYLVCISLYQLVGRRRASSFAGFTLTANHVLGTRSLSWILILFVPIICMIFDVCGKVFSNMFYPTQTQIHLELEAHGKMLAKRHGLPTSERGRTRMSNREREGTVAV
jgi:magnesium-transporting ATPase (P-type)